jgi:hypothetical protein
MIVAASPMLCKPNEDLDYPMSFNHSVWTLENSSGAGEQMMGMDSG